MWTVEDDTPEVKVRSRHTMCAVSTTKGRNSSIHFCGSKQKHDELKEQDTVDLKTAMILSRLLFSCPLLLRCREVL